MKLKFFLMATAAMTLATSCSSDAVVEDQQAANAIQFSVTAGKASRAASYYCNNDKPDQFNVWASVDGKTYFTNESFSSTDQTIWTIDGDYSRFWPIEKVSFYAVKNQTKYNGDIFADVAWNDGTPTIAFTKEKPVQTHSSEQQDLLYAYTTATKNVVDNKCVATLNFRHALSQVVFKAQNKNPKIYVEISEVIVANLQTNGVFTFPNTDTDTDQNIEDHKQGTELPSTGIGSWALPEGQTAVFAPETTTENFGKVPVPYSKEVTEEGQKVLKVVGPVNLTNNETEGKERNGIKHSLIVLPQKLDAWDPTNANTKVPGITGAYFKVLCTIWNVSGTSFDEKKDVKLYDNKYIYIPVNVAWQVGKKYIYTFVFSEKGHAGYDEKGNDVLIPIEFNVTVDDFAKADTKFDGTVDADNGNKQTPKDQD